MQTQEKTWSYETAQLKSGGWVVSLFAPDGTFWGHLSEYHTQADADAAARRFLDYFAENGVQ